MELESIMLSEMSDTDRQILYDPTYMWYPKKLKWKQRTDLWLPLARGGWGENELRGSKIQTLFKIKKFWGFNV